MPLTNEHINIASEIDVMFQELKRKGCSKLQILGEMSDHLQNFKKLMDELGEDGMNQLSLQFNGIYRFGKLLEMAATEIAAGKIKAP